MNVFPENTKKKISPYSFEARNIITKRQKNDIKKSQETKLDQNKKPKKISIRNKKNCFCSSFIIILLIIAVIFSYYFVYLKSNIITQNYSQGSPFLITKNPDKLSADMVKKDGDTRINIVIAGVGGSGHKGSTLTDSIQILSIDLFNNTAGIISLPRDFYYYSREDKVGRKLNTIYQIGEKSKKGDGGKLLKEVVGDILDLNIHYYIHLDFAGFTEIVDSVGGITVDVKKNIYDPYYPDNELEGYEPLYIKAGDQVFDGKKALKYARSRQTTSDFDRSKRQQEIMVAIKDKAFSLGVLTNPLKISEMIKIVGNHLKTDIQIKEFQQLAKSYKDINADKTASVVIDDGARGPLTSTHQYGSYNLIPDLGLTNYDEIQAIVHKIIPDPKIVQEKAKISVKYTRKQHKEAANLINKLTAYGYTISDGGLINSNEFYKNTIQINTQKVPFTVKYLSTRLKNFVQKKTNINNSPDIIIILASA